MAVLKNSIWYTSSAGWSAMTAWATGAAKTVGQMVRQNATPTVGNERVFVCVVAGTTHATTEPTWVVTKGAKTTDNTVTWMEATGLPGLNSDITNTPLSSANRSGAQVLGNLIKNNSATHLFICTTAGTTGAGEPTYDTTTGNTTVDSGCTWTCLGAVGSFTTKWAAPHDRVANAQTSTWAVATDTIYVSSSHAPTQTTGITWAAGGILATPSYQQVICIANGGSIPPGSGDVTTGASETCTGSTAITLGLSTDIWGIAFNSGTTSNTTLTVGNGNLGRTRLTNCALNLTSSGSFANLQLSTAAAAASPVEMTNTTVAFTSGQTSGGIAVLGPTIWRDTPTALSIVGGSSWPASLFAGCRACACLLENVDISAFAGTRLMSSGMGGFDLTLSHCKLPASLVVLPTGGTNSPSDVKVKLINCDSGGTTLRHESHDYGGNHILSTNVVATAGASDGTTSFAWKIATTAFAAWFTPLECLPMVVWNTATAVNVIVTLLGAYNGAALPNNDDIWFDVNYLGTASSANGTRKSAGKANPLSSNAALTASSIAWDTGATARANGHVYSLGDIIKVSTNTGRFFVCTTAGTSAGSEPGGYASAVDGGSVTDNSAVFRAAMRFSMAVTLTSPQPQAAGYLYCYVKAARASSTFWVNPLPALT